MQVDDIDVFIGIDVGKSEHWATALNTAGKKLFDKALPNSEDKLREIYQQLSDHGQLLVVVDQPATIGALAVAVAQAMGIMVGYLPGLSMRRIADLTPGNAKTDAKDAAVIAEAARTMPHTLRAINTSDEDAASLSMLTGFDLDLARQVNQTSNRIRGLYTQIHPALEAALGPWLEHDSVLEVIATWPTPSQLRKAGRARIDAKLKAKGARRHAAWAKAITDALEQQTVTVAGTDAAGVVLPHLARQLIALHTQRADVAAQVEHLVEAHPLYPVLTSMPGVGVRTAATFLAETLGRTFDTGAHLASYAGLTPVTRRSGSSIRGEYVSHGGNKRLKRAMFLSAFASLRSDPASRAYYERKRAQGKRHNQAVLALAHRRILTLYAMIRDGALYDPPAQQLPAAA
ncbi:IS110 family transposase [Actinomyces sp. MRS3W]|uniref:IS110 family transposase n=1 Tax=Actinomyces sp. MRS3W TaxID=2800796 RepID=UPI0028FD5AF9|nr:IS110 family transposase [Actinomyces sp. MRS3W]MDU0348270.1 IS110 family transposase [Actinomyces sp. MRS3W]